MIYLSGIRLGNTTYSSPEAAAAGVEVTLWGAMGRAINSIGGDAIETLNRVTGQIEGKHGGRWPLSGNEWGTVPDRLASRSGAGIKSVRDSMKVGIAPGAPMPAYVWASLSTGKLTVHETGATVSPKTAKYLAIPLRAALSSRGLPLKSGPRAWQNTFVMRSRANNLIIAQRVDKDTIIPLYLLKRSVVIPQRLRMKETVMANLSYFKSKAIRSMEKEFHL